MKRSIIKITSILFCLLVALPAFSAGVYVVPLQRGPSGGFGISLMVNNQGPFLCEIDTGSTNLMLPGDANTCPSCNQNPGITPTSPSALGKKFTVRYHSGRVLIAQAYRTHVLPALPQTPVPAVRQTLGVIVNTGGNHNASPVLGMAQPLGPSSAGLTTYMQSLVQAGVTSDLGFMIGFCQGNRSGSEMVLGGIDPRLKNTTPISTILLPEGYYEVIVQGIGVASGQQNKIVHYLKSSKNQSPAPIMGLLDTGSPYIYLPANYAVSVVSAIKAAAIKSGLTLPAAFWAGGLVPLTAAQVAQLPTVNLMLGGGSVLPLSPQYYVVKNHNNPALRQLAIRGFRESYAVLGIEIFSQYVVYLDSTTATASFYPHNLICSG